MDIIIEDATGNPIADDGAILGGATEAGGGIEQPVKRRPGRPRKDGTAPGSPRSDFDTIAPGSVIGTAGDGGTGTSQTRSAQRSRTTQAKAAVLSVDTFIPLLVGAQFLLLAQLKADECLLSDEQNKLLAESLARVARHYPSVMTEKQQDIFGLVMAVGTIGYAQFTTYKKRVTKEKAARQ